MSAVASRIPTQAMKIEKVKEHIGAIVTGIDLAHPVDSATRKKLYDAAVENVVLVIRGQGHLTPGQVQAAGEMFGELMEDQNRRYLVDGFPLISVLDNRHQDSKGQPAKVGANATWHTDHTNQELPPKFTMLYAVAVPDKGGATSVCNSRAAYEALPDDVKPPISTALNAYAFGGGPKSFKYSVFYEYGAGVDLDNILSGALNGRLRIRFAFFSRTWRKQIVKFDGWSQHFDLVHGGSDPSVATASQTVPTSVDTSRNTTNVAAGQNAMGVSEPIEPMGSSPAVAIGSRKNWISSCV